MTKQPTSCIHVRLNTEKWEDLQLWCNSGMIRISATELMSHLLEAFYEEVVQHNSEFDIEATISGIRAAVKRSTTTLAKKGAACG